MLRDDEIVARFNVESGKSGRPRYFGGVGVGGVRGVGGVTGPTGVTASSGWCAPVQPYLVLDLKPLQAAMLTEAFTDLSKRICDALEIPYAVVFGPVKKPVPFKRNARRYGR